MEKFRRETLLEKSFYHLTEEEIRKMGEAVERLAQRIKNILSIRRRRFKRGKLDLHQTLRRNMSHGGIPFELIFKQRKKDRPKLVILCDVSSPVLSRVGGDTLQANGTIGAPSKLEKFRVSV